MDEYALYKPKTVTNELEDASILTGSFSDLADNEEPTWLREIELPVDRLRTQMSVDVLMDSVDESAFLDYYVREVFSVFSSDFVM